ncbi:DUF4433 domain-containing protein [Aromatoleum buckelii]|nr:DUF4433 domain-containing protein [Aromatoleum buckelii]
MTYQVHEKIVIEGKMTSMAFCPPLPNNDSRILEVPPKFISSACWRGYQGTWEIKNRRLFLIGIDGRYQFRENTPIFAEWFSGTLIVPEGSILEYVHGGFSTVYEHELHITIKDGKAIAFSKIDNRSKFEDTECLTVKDSSKWLSFSMQRFLASRGVEHVVHFTRAENLPSILQHGLYGRNSLKTAGIQTAVNDYYRFDYLPDAICCSISFPNYKMFYRLRQENPGTDWVVLRVKPQVLWEKNCVFCVENAATRAVAQTPLQQRIGLDALQRLFSDIDTAPPRSELRIPDFYPTHPQAEVLIMDKIEPDMILDVLVDQKERIRDHKRLSKIVHDCVGGKEFCYDKSYFDARMDYVYWRGTQIG